jgi:hypothetical protein
LCGWNLQQGTRDEKAIEGKFQEWDLLRINTKLYTHVKGGLQEVPKGDNWPRRHFSFPGKAVCT